MLAQAVEALEGRQLLAAGLHGIYFEAPNNLNYDRDKVIASTPVGSRNDPIIDFIAPGGAANQDPLGGGAFNGANGANQRIAGTGLADDQFFTGRWEGTITPDVSGNYTFYTRSDDGVRLQVNGKTLINRWYADRDVPAAPGDFDLDGTGNVLATLPLSAGVQYPVTLEFNQGGGGAAVGLYWSADTAHFAPEFIPTTALNDVVAAPSAAPGAPAVSSGALPHTTSMYVNWADNSNNESYYQIEYKLPADANWTVAGQAPFNSQSFKITGLAANTAYQVRVGAGNSNSIVYSPVQTLSTSATDPVAGTGLKVTHWDNGSFDGSSPNFTGASATFLDPTINHDWGNGSPTDFLPATDPTVRIGPDNFSTRYEGFVRPEVTGDYTVYVQADDGARVMIDTTEFTFPGAAAGSTVDLTMSRAGGIGNLFISSNTIHLVAGQQYPIIAEQDEQGGGAGLRVYWSSSDVAREIIPQVDSFPLINPAMDGTAPALTGARNASGQPTLSWVDTVNNEDAYELQRSMSASGPWTAIRRQNDPNGAITYTDASALTPGTTYFYRVLGAALNADGTWRYFTPSDPVSVTTVAANAGIQGQYYDNGGYTAGDLLTNFTGPMILRKDPNVAYNWGNGAPDPSMGPDNFSVRYTAYFTPTVTGLYTFASDNDDGYRLVVNNQVLQDGLNVPQGNGTKEIAPPITLNAGVRYPLVFEMDEGGGGAVAQLYVQGPNDGDINNYVSIDNLTLPDLPAHGGTGLTATPGALGTQLNWTPSADFGIAGYIVERALDANNDQQPDGGTWTQVGKATDGRPELLGKFTDTSGLASGTTYIYRVRPYNLNGEGPNSNIATATTLSGTVTGTASTASGDTNLTTEGVVDWKRWGQGGTTGLAFKTGGVISVVQETENN
ncbi:MAG TPA: PA14 domain-containing protein, partial [Tepidisphaeraceae bacterium]